MSNRRDLAHYMSAVDEHFLRSSRSGDRRGRARRGLLLGCSLAALTASLAPAAAQSAVKRPPAFLGLTAADFDTPEYRADWGLAAINASTAYARGFTGAGVLVAVYDTGIDRTHPEFAGRISSASRNYFSDPGIVIDPAFIQDADGHGTHVSGTIGAARDGIGMMGVAYDSTILTLYMLPDESYSKSHPNLSVNGPAGIAHAADQGANIFNGSYGPSLPQLTIKDNSGNWIRNPNYVKLYEQEYQLSGTNSEYTAIKRAADSGMLLVFAAGNDRIDQPVITVNPTGAALYPYIRPGNAASGVYQFFDDSGRSIDQSKIDFSDVSGFIVSVVATDQNNKIAGFSDWCGVAAAWCIAAPGINIYSTQPVGKGYSGYDSNGNKIYDGSNYGPMQGTSMAAPRVSGAAAVLRQAFPFLTAPQIAQTMFTTATHLGDGPGNVPNAVYGWGLLNLGKAIDGPGQFTSTWTVDTTYKGQAYYGTFANDISGVGGLTKIGLGTLELTGTNTYQGGTAVYGGTLAVWHDANLGADGTGLALGKGGQLQVLAHYFSTARPVTLDGHGGLRIDDGTAIFDGVFADGARPGSLTKTGFGTLELTADNTYTGGTSIYGGSVAVTRDANLGAASGGLTLGDGGFLQIRKDGFTTTRPVTLDGLGILGSTRGTASVFGGVIADGNTSGRLMKVGYGTVDLTADNTYTGGTTIFVGTLAVTRDANLGAAGGGLSFANGATLQVRQDGFSTARPVTLDGKGGLRINSGTATFAGVIADGSRPGFLLKDGSGTAVLTAANTHTGGTTVEAGTLALAATGRLVSPVSIGPDGTFANAGLASGGVTNAGTLTTSGTITSGLINTGSVTASAGRIDGAIRNNAGLFTVSGAVTSDGIFANAAGATLAVSGTGAYSLAGPLTNTGTVTIARTASLTAPAGLGNAGSLTNGGTITGAVANTGTLATSGTIVGSLANAGQTTNSGTITGGAGNTGSLVNSGAIAGGVSNSGTLATSGAITGGLANAGWTQNSGVIAGGVSNAGTLATSGAIAGGLTNTGTVTASAGRIDGAIRNDAGTLAVTGAVASNGTFANAAGATLAVSGAGAYSLNGPLTNTGTVTIAQTASLTAPAGLSNAGLIASDGILTTDLTNTGTARLSGQLNGALTNTGSLLFTGTLAGLTSLTNAGPLDLNGSALTLANLTGPASGVIGNGALTVTGSASTTYAGTILEGTAPTSLTKAGSGTLNLTGTGRFSGPTTIQAGTLSLNGFWTSPVNVDAAGTLRGTGTIAAPVRVAGALRPGNSPGTLTVAGPVSFAAGSVFGLDIDGTGIGAGAGNYSRLLAVGPSGTVAAGGTLVPVLRGITGNAGNGFTPVLGQRFAVLAAQGGLGGSFTGLAQPATGLPTATRFDALYGATGLDLVVTPAAYANLAPLGLAQTGNARAVGAALDLARPEAGTRPDAARARFYDPLYTAAPASLAGGLASLSGQSYGDAVMADLTARRLVAATIDRHMTLGGGSASFSAGGAGLGPNRTAIDLRGAAGSADQALATGEGRIWADALYGFGARGGDRAAGGANLDAGGLLLGIDRQAGTDTLIGGAFSYLRETGASRSAGAGFAPGTFTADSYGGTLYGSTRLGGVILRGTAGGSYVDGRVARTVTLGSAVTRASGAPAGGDLGLSGFAGYALRTGLPVEFVPELGFSYDRLTRGRVAERGGLAAQAFTTAPLDSARILAGARIASLDLNGEAGLRLETRAYWAHELSDTAALVRSSLFGAPFATRTSALSRDGAVLGVNLTGSVAQGVSLSVSYSGEVRPGATAQVFSAGLQAAW